MPVAERTIPSTAIAPPARTGIIAVVVTYDRPAELARCLAAIARQQPAPDAIHVLDNASPGDATRQAIAAHRHAVHVRMPANLGGAGGFAAGIAHALDRGARAVWVMDDDGLPAPGCLRLLADAVADGIGIAAPLVVDIADPTRLAFALRRRGRSRFEVAAVADRAAIDGFAHLFNGALIHHAVVDRIGLPDPRFLVRGDEVEFRLRARRAGIRIRTVTDARFLHPAATPEIHRIAFGLFHAVEPLTPQKRYCQFRNRGWIFRAYGKWGFLVGDVFRYAWFYLLQRRDPRAFAAWLRATAEGWRGDFMRRPAPPLGGA